MQWFVWRYYHEDLKAIDVQYTNCQFHSVLLHGSVHSLHNTHTYVLSANLTASGHTIHMD